MSANLNKSILLTMNNLPYQFLFTKKNPAIWKISFINLFMINWRKIEKQSHPKVKNLLQRKVNVKHFILINLHLNFRMVKQVMIKQRLLTFIMINCKNYYSLSPLSTFLSIIIACWQHGLHWLSLFLVLAILPYWPPPLISPLDIIQYPHIADKSKFSLAS